jgi:hypothetical protein
VELLDCLGRLGPDLVFDGQGADDPAVRDDVQDGPPVATLGFGLRLGLEAHICEQTRSPNSHHSTIYGRPSAATSQRLKASCGGRLNPARLRATARCGARQRVATEPRRTGSVQVT